jgi:hypothetical protein
VEIRGNVFEPCVGGGAIIRAADPPEVKVDRRWLTNDLDARWPATWHDDAAQNVVWDSAAKYGLDWTVTNPPFTPAIEILDRALEHSRIGVAMHLRASIHEVLQTGIRRTWMAEHTPTGILWLPRFAYQRSKSTGLWTTDSVCACWVVWLKDPAAPRSRCWLQTPAAVRFLSCEPLLSHINIAQFISPNYYSVGGRQWIGAGGIGWVIIGGESGHAARAFDLDWARDIIVQCRRAGVPVAPFFKQAGAQPYDSDRTASGRSETLHFISKKGGDPSEWPADLRVREFPEASR